MAKIHNLLGEKKSNKDFRFNASEFSYKLKTDFNTFEELLEQHKAFSVEKQILFMGFVMNANVSKIAYDVYDGVLDLGSVKFDLQVIGTITGATNYWSFAWSEDNQLELDPSLLEDAYKLKKIGEEKNIPEFKNGSYKVEDDFQHKMGGVASGLLRATTYHPIPHEDLIVLTTIRDDRIYLPQRNSFFNTIKLMPVILNEKGTNPKNMLLNYLMDRHFRVHVSEDNTIRAMDDSDTIFVLAEFDESDKLLSLNYKM